MTWEELLKWVNDPNRKPEELKEAAQALGLPVTGGQSQILTRIRAFIAAQPNLRDKALWAPKNVVPEHHVTQEPHVRHEPEPPPRETVQEQVVPVVIQATPKPTNVKAVADEKSITLTWDETPGATKYHIYRKDPGKAFEKVIVTDHTSVFVDNKVHTETLYKYYVMAEGPSGFSTNSDIVETTIQKEKKQAHRSAHKKSLADSISDFYHKFDL